MGVEGTLGFLGFGNMGGAILRGLLHAGTVASDQAVVFDVDPDKCLSAKDLGVCVAGSPAELAKTARTLLLAVKPQSIDEALAQTKAGLSPETLVVSIAAGISIAFIQERLGRDIRVIRVMPNTPALVGVGAAGIALAPNCTDDDAETARTIFEAVGAAEMVSETVMDAVTALSGSGPAYFFYMVECLVKAAMAQGLDEGRATRLATQTLLGAGRLLAESGEPAAVLRERVTSKGGTTQAALTSLREEGFERIVGAAVAAAAARSKELGK